MSIVLWLFLEGLLNVNAQSLEICKRSSGILVKTSIKQIQHGVISSD